ncbi:hypothetical protein USDA257_c53600 [Sinorhizobium fredii USDA 257]|uniref:Uncharacterized protein n=1 Tax=Sinorhizobium fredii (strain USDA 257) TaxID=1185652 RepID=I3XDC8_SINF2|nr:hypothetical protein USDA257_c53600 [Sinorhizobium fredii USDA 257]
MSQALRPKPPPQKSMFFVSSRRFLESHICEKARPGAINGYIAR